MIICDKNKIIFYHIPKTGGTTIQKHIKNEFPNSIEYWGIDWENGDKSHMTYLKSKEIISNTKLDNYYKICFIRNPYDRLYSGYLELKIHNLISKELSFREFVMDFINSKIINTNKFIHIKPMYLFMIDENNNNKMDFIGKYELYDYYKNSLYKKLNITDCKQIDYNIKNKSHINFLRYINEYDYSMIQKVNELYDNDFYFLKYKKL